MLSAHGSYELSFDEENAIFKCTFSGSWNVETVILMDKELPDYKLPAKWTSLGVFEGFVGILPDAIEMYKTIVDRSAANGLRANAVVGLNPNLEYFFESLIEYRGSNYDIVYDKFDNEEDARQWLIEILQSS